MPPYEKSSRTAGLGRPADETLALAGGTRIAWAVFDPDWYLAAYPEVGSLIQGASADAVLRFYLERGQALRHSPNLWFDETWHLGAYPRVAERVRNGRAASGFDAYCREGFHGRSPHWLFNEFGYRMGQSELTEAVLAADGMANGYDHYLRKGDRLGLSGHRLFDPAIYLASLPPPEAREASSAGCFAHYLTRNSAGRPDIRVSLYFDPDWYQVAYPSAATDSMWLSALHHYLTNAAPGRFDPLPLFSESYYRRLYPAVADDVAAGKFRNGYDHFLRRGAREQKSPSPGVDLAKYAAAPPVTRWLLENPGDDAFTHYMRHERGMEPSLAPGSDAPPVAESRLNALVARKANVLGPLMGRTPIDFTCAGAPVVTVVLVMRDQFALTLMTLASLRANFHGAIEVILADAGSRDESSQIEYFVHGAHRITLSDAIGTCAAMNAAVHHATAEAVLFLDSGIELCYGAVSAALRRLDTNPTAGAVGGKMIRANGLLREAGYILWRGGTFVGYRRDAPPDVPEVNFVRPVDFCSFGFLMVRRAALSRVVGLDSGFISLRHAEADFGLRLMSVGFATIYDPAAVVHVLGDPDGADSGSSNAADHDRFIQKHADGLKDRYVSNDHALVFARLAGPPARRVLFIEDTVPVRILGSGFVRSNDIIHAMASMGYLVTVFPITGCTRDLARVYADMPDTAEVMHDRGYEDFGAFLAERRAYYDAIWIGRTHNLDSTKPFLEKLYTGNGVPPVIVLDTEAIHAWRDMLRAGLANEPMADLDAAIRQELVNADIGRTIVVVSEMEAAKLRLLGYPDVTVIGHVRPLAPTPRAFPNRSGLLFVGAMHEADSPNHDSLRWFVDKVLPIVEESLGWETRLTVVGFTGPSVDLSPLTRNSRVVLRGAVSNLQPVYDSHRVFVAPTRYAAGIPYKIHEAASFGLPVVGAELLRGQLGWSDGQEMLAAETTDPVAFAGQIVRLYRNEALWTHVRAQALERLARENNAEAYARSIRAALEPAVPVPVVP